jgi:hypothetical protein
MPKYLVQVSIPIVYVLVAIYLIIVGILGVLGVFT